MYLLRSQTEPQDVRDQEADEGNRSAESDGCPDSEASADEQDETYAGRLDPDRSSPVFTQGERRKTAYLGKNGCGTDQCWAGDEDHAIVSDLR